MLNVGEEFYWSIGGSKSFEPHVLESTNIYVIRKQSAIHPEQFKSINSYLEE